MKLDADTLKIRAKDYARLSAKLAVQAALLYEGVTIL